MTRHHGTLAAHLDRRIRQVSNDGFDVTAYVSDLGEFRRLYLDERRVGETRKAPGDFCFPDTRWTDHEDIFRSDLGPHVDIDLTSPPTITQSNCHCTLGGLLADNVFVQLVYDLSWRHIGHFYFPTGRCASSPKVSIVSALLV